MPFGKKYLVIATVLSLALVLSGLKSDPPPGDQKVYTLTTTEPVVYTFISGHEVSKTKVSAARDARMINASVAADKRRDLYRLLDVMAENERQERLARQEAARQREAQAQAAKPKLAPASPPPSPSGGSVWDRLAQCESGGNWSINTSNAYSGGLQFHPQTWNAHGGGQYAPYAYQASREQQIAIAEKVLASQGWGAWPACSRKLGLR